MPRHPASPSPEDGSWGFEGVEADNLLLMKNEDINFKKLHYVKQVNTYLPDNVIYNYNMYF